LGPGNGITGADAGSGLPIPTPNRLSICGTTQNDNSPVQRAVPDASKGASHIEHSRNADTRQMSEGRGCNSILLQIGLLFYPAGYGLKHLGCNGLFDAGIFVGVTGSAFLEQVIEAVKFHQFEVFVAAFFQS